MLQLALLLTAGRPLHTSTNLYVCTLNWLARYSSWNFKLNLMGFEWVTSQPGHSSMVCQQITRQLNTWCILAHLSKLLQQNLSRTCNVVAVALVILWLKHCGIGIVLTALPDLQTGHSEQNVPKLDRQTVHYVVSQDTVPCKSQHPSSLVPLPSKS